jgi:hypothetical protein
MNKRKRQSKAAWEASAASRACLPSEELGGKMNKHKSEATLEMLQATGQPLRSMTPAKHGCVRVRVRVCYVFVC